MADLEVSDISSLSRLVHLFGLLTDFESARRIDRPIADFCDLVERALVGLGGSDSADLGHALEILGSVRRGIGVASDKVAYSEFADLVGEMLDGLPGSQPLRTGAVTATSLVPLRGVPYRVICLIGFDDGATSVVESESGDLIDAQRFVGDVDARLDQRRTILDVLMSASDRVIITCNGRSIKNNTPVPMVTPLQELSDVCLRLGVPTFQSPAGETCAAIEIIHPRHGVSTSNFIPGGIIAGEVWSSDVVARDLANLGSPSSSTGKDGQ
jgi:exodeoxyribonuclease V gamma subunit